ncbi:MAG: hypothetical protein JOZ75_10165 [Candidatus Dormibacteraeota bacterium]|nr:hypothetical protein [Candidatus Dormibacteraeota bacterium]
MGRYGVPRPVRYGFGILVGASVFAATSVAMFSLAASAGNSSDLLGGLTNSLGTVTGGVVNTVSNTVNSVAGPSGTVCQLLCNVGSSGATQPQSSSNPLGSTLNCVTAGNCSIKDPLPVNNATSNGSATGGATTVPPVSNPPPVGSAPVARGPVAGDPPAITVPSGVTAPGSLVPPPPSSINLPTATSGINFGKAPFLWPLFLGLDVLGAGAVVLALRKTWSRPVAD